MEYVKVSSQYGWCHSVCALCGQSATLHYHLDKLPGGDGCELIVCKTHSDVVDYIRDRVRDGSLKIAGSHLADSAGKKVKPIDIIEMHTK